MVENIPATWNYSRLLNDVEIVAAIKNGLINLEDPSIYIKYRKDDLIQPASMDLILIDLDSFESRPIIGSNLESRGSFVKNVEYNNNFVTFPPGSETEAYFANLNSWDGERIFPVPELRSTLRRAGLDIGFNPLGVGSRVCESGCFINIRNPQNYPVSVEKGLKSAQALWFDKGIRECPEGFGIVENEEKVGSGKAVISRKELENLIESGDLYLSDLNSMGHEYCDGFISLHAGEVRNSFCGGHVIISSEEVSGLSFKTENFNSHDIYPGEFVDIETTDKIGLSDRVAMRVFYDFESVHGVFTRDDVVNNIHTKFSAGGWIDPGYGFNKEGGAPFSVQRKAFSNPYRINKGDLVGYGVLWFFPKGVDKPYGSERNSHYSEDKGFTGPKIN